MLVFVPPQVMLLVNRLKTNIFFVAGECALKIALTRSIFQPKMHQISFGCRAPPDPLAVLRGAYFVREGRDEWERGRIGGERARRVE